MTIGFRDRSCKALPIRQRSCFSFRSRLAEGIGGILERTKSEITVKSDLVRFQCSNLHHALPVLSLRKPDRRIASCAIGFSDRCA